MSSAMEMLDAGEADAFCSLVHEGCVTHAGQPAREGIRRRLDEFLRAFSDAQFAVVDQLAEGDLVSGRYEFSARHTGPWHGRAPEGRIVSVTVMDMARIRDGQIVEYWAVTDTASLRRQLS
jgi:predicted ester cyclase